MGLGGHDAGAHRAIEAERGGGFNLLEGELGEVCGSVLLMAWMIAAVMLE